MKSKHYHIVKEKVKIQAHYFLEEHIIETYLLSCFPSYIVLCGPLHTGHVSEILSHSLKHTQQKVFLHTAH